ncbi:hypothetical protein BDU57DRAFT_506609 [Ampelomyces quisqualis]|uniref:Uncharacterized protein n=1 Tax=Ampelomyces quisqualis TaxID=50730 RepID=A0A6A5Q930_AMPQU|nr:hypothetical protein BDU57DRAFT_506609 [Ampelomyces quisqualis]
MCKGRWAHSAIVMYLSMEFHGHGSEAFFFCETHGERMHHEAVIPGEQSRQGIRTSQRHKSFDFDTECAFDVLCWLV